jgi:uncharacterized protein (DUF2384 family)
MNTESGSAHITPEGGNVFEDLGFSPQEAATLKAESTRRIGFEKLVSLVRQMVSESGDPNGFHAEAWVTQWLETPLPALGGEKPSSLMESIDGQEKVLALVSRMPAGGYA